MPDKVLFPYPDPAVVGLKMDPTQMATIATVVSDSSADRDGFKAGDAIATLNGQPLLSIADIQWVLHHAPATAKLPAQVRRANETLALTMTLKDGWRRGDISWRASTWQLRQMGFGGMQLKALNDEECRQAKLSPDCMALRVVHVGEFGEHAIAKGAGLQKGDIVVSFGGTDQKSTESELLAYALQQKRRGDILTLSVVRGGTRKTMSFALP
jgi:S1-C subfamily serine protease